MVTDGGLGELKENKDYTLTYQNNTQLGQATITITGMGNYDSNTTTSVNFTINVADISQGALSLNKNSYIYNQQTQKPTETIVLNGDTLKIDTDYTVAYHKDSETGEVVENPTDVGTYYVVLTGKGNYSGTKSIAYTITQCDITGATITFSASSYTWQGANVEAVIQSVVTNAANGSVTVPSSSYEVSYTNNDGAKTATATITASGNYTGTVTKDYVISCGTLNSFLYLNIGDNVSVNGTMYVTYNDEAFSPVVVVRDSLQNQLTEQDYTITYTRNGEITTDFESAGTITITATPKQNTTTGSTNYTGSSVGTFVINALDITDTAVIVVSGTYTYNGQGQEATIEVYAASGGKQLTVNTDYNTPTYQENINAGDAQVSVTFKGNYTGSATQTFVINKRDISDADINITGVNTEYTYNRFAQKPVPTVTDTEVLTLGSSTVLKETTKVKKQKATNGIPQMPYAQKLAKPRKIVQRTFEDESAISENEAHSVITIKR